MRLLEGVSQLSTAEGGDAAHLRQVLARLSFDSLKEIELRREEASSAPVLASLASPELKLASAFSFSFSTTLPLPDPRMKTPPKVRAIPRRNSSSIATAGIIKFASSCRATRKARPADAGQVEHVYSPCLTKLRRQFVCTSEAGQEDSQRARDRALMDPRSRRR